MKTKGKRYAVALAASVAGSIWAIGAPAGAQVASPPTRDGAVSMKEVDLRAFITDVSNATGRTFIVDPRVQGKVTVLAHQSLSERELFDVFLSTLRVHGYVAVPTVQGAYRIVPDEVAVRDAGPSSGRNTENRYVTQVFRLQYADAESVANALKPLLSERGQSTVTRRSNSVIVVDYGATVNRVSDLVRRLDQDTSVYRSIRLRNSSASDMARLAQAMATGIGEEQGRSLLQATPVTASNTLVLRGDAGLLGRVTPIIEQLDASAVNDSAVSVIPLRYAVAEELVPVLQQISSSMNAPAQAADGAPPANRTANIASHRATNSLIINAPPDTQEALARVVRSLDVRRQQVRVEAIIVEVSDTAAQELGIQFLASGSEGSSVPFLATNYPNSAPNLLALTGALALRGDDAANTPVDTVRRAAINSLLTAGGLIGGIGGQRSDGSLLGVILNAVAQDRDSNVLSTPSVMTLENETATILVGQQIPVTTGEALSGNNDNPFRTVQREDVGVKLKVRPQISDNGAIRLQISQEVSSIFGQIISSSTDLITNRRAIDTVVQVDGGQVVVLGGLMQDDVSESDQGVPGLRRVPLAGRLFRSEGKQRKRTNLMVFLRPTIVSTPEQAAEVTRREIEALRAYRGIDPTLVRTLDQQLRLPTEAPQPIGVVPNE